MSEPTIEVRFDVCNYFCTVNDAPQVRILELVQSRSLIPSYSADRSFDLKLHLFKIAIIVFKEAFDFWFCAHSHQIFDISYRSTSIDSYGEAPFERAMVVQLIDVDAQFIHQKLDYGLDWKPVFNRKVEWGPILK